MMSAEPLWRLNIPQIPRAKVLPRRDWNAFLPGRSETAMCKLDELAARIDAQNDRVAVLMRERNAHPEDEALKQKLARSFDELSAMEQEHADALQAHFRDDSFPVLSEADKKLRDEAQRILDAYENPSSGNASP